MGLNDLYNTTISIKSESVTTSGSQRVSTHGAAGDAIAARREHITDAYSDTVIGEDVQEVCLYYMPADTTIKKGDLFIDSSDSLQYKVIAVLKAEGFGTTHHLEVTAVRQ